MLIQAKKYIYILSPHVFEKLTQNWINNTIIILFDGTSNMIGCLYSSILHIRIENHKLELKFLRFINIYGNRDLL